MIKKGILREHEDSWVLDFGPIDYTLITDFHVVCEETGELREADEWETREKVKPYLGQECLMMADEAVYATDGVRLGSGYC